MVAVKKDKISGDALGTGRRKSSVARVRVRAGSGKITVNSKPLSEYFVNEQHQNAVTSTLDAVEHSDSVDVLVRVNGGGMTGQKRSHGLARALVSYNESLHESLQDGGFLTRDSRMKSVRSQGFEVLDAASNSVSVKHWFITFSYGYRSQ